MIAFEIPGPPVPFARAGSNGKRRYTPGRQAAYMAEVAIRASQVMGADQPFEGAVRFQVRVENTHPIKWKADKKARTKWRISTPDADNILKLLADSMEGIVYLNDSQIAHAEIQKIYSLKDCVYVSVMELES